MILVLLRDFWKVRGSVHISSLLHYKVDIFSFSTAVLIIYFSASESFLIIGLVGLVKFFILYPLMCKNIFLKNYLSNILVFMTIEKILIIGLVGLVIFYFYLIKGLIYFLFWSAVLINNYRIVEKFLKNRRLVLVIPLSISLRGYYIFIFWGLF